MGIGGLRQRLVIGGLLVFTLVLPACGLSLDVKTQERWYPNYSHYRITQPHLIVFIHGYGGFEDTFAFVPYLISRFPGRTIMYFNYDTGPLRGRLDSFGVIAQHLRTFLHDNVFYRAPDTQVDVICHSTGCPIVRQYIANNPFDHRIGKLLVVAGANYGAYYSETTSKIKEFLPGAHGDKQIQELKYGSFSLFFLQQRWHHLYVKTLLVGEKKPPREDWLRSTPFEEFVHVVSGQEDKKYQNAALKLPEIMAVVATHDWRSWGSRKFSDGVVRVESAIPDCRFLAQGPVRNPLLNPECADRSIVFLPCFHTELFSEERCRNVILDLVEYFLIGHKKKEYREFYAAHVKDGDVGQYLARLSVAALWVRVFYKELLDRDKLHTSDDWERALDRITVELIGAERDPPWPFGLYESDFREAVRSSQSSPERIFYYKYLAVPQTGAEVQIQILLDGRPLTIKTPAGQNGKVAGAYHLLPGKTSMISCESKSLTELVCEEVTSDRDVPMDRIRSRP